MTTCTPTECWELDCGYTVGPFVISNNKWANQSATQSVYVCQENNNFGWEWTGDGNWNAPCAIAGNNRGAWDYSTTPYLPIKYSNLNSFVAELSWTYPKQPTGVWNLSYDIYWWDSNYSQRQYNIMIWIQTSVYPPDEEYVGEVSDGLNTYKYYHGYRIDRPWDCFILKNQNMNQTSHKVDIKALMNQIAGLNGNWYIPDIQVMNENESGSGRIEINQIKYILNGNNICIEGECGTTNGPCGQPTCYKCSGTSCINDNANGTYTTCSPNPCTTNGPCGQPTCYKCNGTTCQQDNANGTYTTCTPNPCTTTLYRYYCDNNYICQQTTDPNAPYADQNSCATACKQPSSSNNGNCLQIGNNCVPYIYIIIGLGVLYLLKK